MNELTEAALMGTGRAGAPAVTLPGPLPDAPDTASPERRLLRDVAVLRVHRDAGRRPERVSGLGDPAPDETRPVCPPRAAAQLTMILGTYPDLLEEWLGALRTAGLVIPPRHVRALLDFGTHEPAIAVALEPVLSARGRWLAALHGPWAWAADSDPTQRWETGTRAERLHMLAVNPALTLIASTWDSDGARDREAFLAALDGHQTAQHEPFLEQALTDRSQSVRETAAGLLSALPGSAYAQRMRERALALVGSGRRTLTVELPSEMTTELTREGLNGIAPHGIGRGAWIARQIIRLTPLDAWAQIEGDPGKLLGRRVADGMGDVLREAWAEATIRQRNPAWAAALLARGAGAQKLVPLLAPADLEAFALETLKRDSRGDWLADVISGPWSERLTLKVAEWITRQAYPDRWAEALGRRGDPRLAGRLPQADPASNAGLQLRVADSKLALRRDMLDTLKETTPA